MRDALQAEQWHFMKPEERSSFLHEYLPEEAFRAYDALFSDFRMGGYRVFGAEQDLYKSNNCRVYGEE